MRKVTGEKVFGLIMCVALFSGCPGGGGKSPVESFKKAITEYGNLCLDSSCDSQREKTLRDLKKKIQEELDKGHDANVEAQLRWQMSIVDVLELVQMLNATLHSLEQIIGGITGLAPLAVQCAKGTSIIDIIAILELDFDKINSLLSDIDAQISRIEKITQNGENFSYFVSGNDFIPIQIKGIADLSAISQGTVLDIYIDLRLRGEFDKIELEGLGTGASAINAIIKLLLSHNTCLDVFALLGGLSELSQYASNDIVKLLRILPKYFDKDLLKLIDFAKFSEIPDDIINLAGRASRTLDIFGECSNAEDPCNDDAFYYYSDSQTEQIIVNIDFENSVLCLSNCLNASNMTDDDRKIDVIPGFVEAVPVIKSVLGDLATKMEDYYKNRTVQEFYIDVDTHINPILEPMNLTLCSTCPTINGKNYVHLFPPALRIAVHKIFPRDITTALGLRALFPALSGNEWNIEAEVPEGTTFPTTTTSQGDPSIPPPYIFIDDSPHFSSSIPSDCVSPVFVTGAAPSKRTYMDTVNITEADMLLYIQSETPDLGGILEYDPQFIGTFINAWYAQNATLYAQTYPSNPTHPACNFSSYGQGWKPADQFLNSTVLAGAQLIYLKEILQAFGEAEEQIPQGGQ